MRLSAVPPPGMTPQGMTPAMSVSGQSGITPGRTPMRDKLNINQMDEFEDGAFEQVAITCWSSIAYWLIVNRLNAKSSSSLCIPLLMKRKCLYRN